MPRTKNAANKKKKSTINDQGPQVQIPLAFIDGKEETMIKETQAQLKTKLREIKSDFTKYAVSFPTGMLDVTLGVLSRGEYPGDRSWNSKIIFGNSTLANGSNTLGSTQSTIKNIGSNLKKMPPSRSPDNDDEGYTTAESTRGTTSGSSKRSRSQTAKSNLHQPSSQTSIKRTRRSRSADRVNSAATVSQSTRQSRSRTKEHTQVSRSNSKTTSKKNPTTPLNRMPPFGTGTITPKCTKNTPLIFMRRPKVGEMAWSNQGSPLLVYGSSAQDRTANINIPIGDDVLSLMPTRGPMRTSEIPEIEGDTKAQLETLRDNLMQMCKFIGK